MNNYNSQFEFIEYDYNMHLGREIYQKTEQRSLVVLNDTVLFLLFHCYLGDSAPRDGSAYKHKQINLIVTNLGKQLLKDGFSWI